MRVAIMTMTISISSIEMCEVVGIVSGAPSAVVASP